MSATQNKSNGDSAEKRGWLEIVRGRSARCVTAWWR